jgi:Na+/H+-dicarboxylate symporter
MARTSVNVLGNCLATVVIARSEGAFQESPASPVRPEDQPQTLTSKPSTAS